MTYAMETIGFLDIGDAEHAAQKFPRCLQGEICRSSLGKGTKKWGCCG